MEYSSNKRTKQDFDNYVNNLTEPKRKEPMNETTFTPVAEANTPAAAPLTDDQIAAILAASPGYITEPEVTEDEVTVH